MRRRQNISSVVVGCGLDYATFGTASTRTVRLIDFIPYNDAVRA